MCFTNHKLGAIIGVWCIRKYNFFKEYDCMWYLVQGTGHGHYVGALHTFSSIADDDEWTSHLWHYEISMFYLEFLLYSHVRVYVVCSLFSTFPNTVLYDI